MADPPKNFRSAFGPLGDLLGFPLRQVDERWRASLGARLAPLGITVSRAVALFFVEHNPGCSQAQLGAALHVNRPSTARAVDDLVAVGAVERSKAGGNARDNALHLTATGLALHARIDAETRAHQQEFFAPLSAAEQERLRALMLKLLGGR
jgi:DNA-binding MarR family transcriptional regulator